MYFHVDESGNTGNNLFDSAQPTLSYGVLSSLGNVDELGAGIHRAVLSSLGVESLHAAELGMERIDSIVPLLTELHVQMDFNFDYYFIEKPTYALVQFFEAVYDAGLNDAVEWNHYWTPMRFLLIGALGELLDEPFLRRSWSLSCERRIATRLGEVVDLLVDARETISSSHADARLKEILIGPLNFGINYPDKLDFGTGNPKIISPNAVAFQFVVTALGRHLRSVPDTTSVLVTIDHQQQFNAAQLKTYETQRLIAEGFKKAPAEQREYILNHPLYQHLDREEALAAEVPQRAPRVARSSQSIGLQLVDIYLWLANRTIQGIELPPRSAEFVELLLRSGHLDGIWMAGMLRRWRAFEAQLPKFEDLTPEQLKAARALREELRARVAGHAAWPRE
jgi:hypothetical protein